MGGIGFELARSTLAKRVNNRIEHMLRNNVDQTKCSYCSIREIPYDYYVGIVVMPLFKACCFEVKCQQRSNQVNKDFEQASCFEANGFLVLLLTTKFMPFDKTKLDLETTD